MGGVKGCFVCGRDHRDNDQRLPDELRAAIMRLKDKHPSAMLIMTDLDVIDGMAGTDTEREDPDKDSTDRVEWADEEEIESCSIIY